HDAFAWLRPDAMVARMEWPSQRAAIRELAAVLADPRRSALREVPLDGPKPPYHESGSFIAAVAASASTLDSRSARWFTRSTTIPCPASRGGVRSGRAMPQRVTFYSDGIELVGYL